MRRRKFITLLGGMTATWPLAARAQQPIKHIGFLSAYPADVGKELVGCFGKGLAELGWVEGQNISIDYRWVGSQQERYAAFATELVGLRPDLIACNSTPAAQALQRATAEIPVVFMSVSDPVASGIVSNLAHPQANVTGLSNFLSASAGKLLELFKTAVPHLSRVLVLYDHANPGKALEAKEIEAGALSLGFAIEAPDARNGEDITRAISAAAQTGGVGVITLIDGVTNSNRSLIIDLTTKSRLPTIFDSRAFVDVGGLMSYGLNLCAHFKRAASYVDKILKGAKPADLPVELPTTFELVFNLKTAKTIGVTAPVTMLTLADEVIE